MNSILSDTERMARLRLARSQSVGPATFRDLLNHLPNAVEALAALPELARRGNRNKSIRIASEDDIRGELKALKKYGASMVVLGDADYPQSFVHLDPPPPIFTAMGDKSLLTRPAFAIVGSRNASAAGQKMASILARDLGSDGYCIISGLARGIDAAAHHASLKSGTIAVLGGGIDVFYPEENRALQKLIGEQGLLIAEMPPDTQPRANLFPRRNRLISGLSLGVVVVEAAMRSGSLITARYALEQGRDVFAVPGSPLDPRARGANSLLKQGAILVESAEDILSSFSPPRTERLLEPSPPDYVPSNASPANIDDHARGRVLEALGPTPVLKDEIVRVTGLSAAEVAIILLELTLSDRVERSPGDRFNLLPPDE
jgi:DNA processing protein